MSYMNVLYTFIGMLQFNKLLQDEFYNLYSHCLEPSKSDRTAHVFFNTSMPTQEEEIKKAWFPCRKVYVLDSRNQFTAHV